MSYVIKKQVGDFVSAKDGAFQGTISKVIDVREDNFKMQEIISNKTWWQPMESCVILNKEDIEELVNLFKM